MSVIRFIVGLLVAILHITFTLILALAFLLFFVPSIVVWHSLKLQ